MVVALRMSAKRRLRKPATVAPSVACARAWISHSARTCFVWNEISNEVWSSGT